MSIASVTACLMPLKTVDCQNIPLSPIHVFFRSYILFLQNHLLKYLTPKRFWRGNSMHHLFCLPRGTWLPSFYKELKSCKVISSCLVDPTITISYRNVSSAHSPTFLQSYGIFNFIYLWKLSFDNFNQKTFNNFICEVVLLEC